MSGQIAVQLARGHCRQPTHLGKVPARVGGSGRPGSGLGNCRGGRARGSPAGPGPPPAPVPGLTLCFPTWTTLTL